MDYQKIAFSGGDTSLLGIRHFSLEEILDCGQCFRWDRVDDHTFRGVALGRACTVSQTGDTVTFHGVSQDEVEALWLDYFDLTRDYSQVKAVLERDSVMRDAVAFTPGMRVLRQPPWEALCSFIISANNNIKRIKGIVARLCEEFGEPLGEGAWDFPTPQRLAELTEQDLAPVRLGYRARYLLDAARLVSSGELQLAPLYTLPLAEARTQLRRICGVGAKVAECVLLYGFARAECVPLDVWIKRAIEQLYPQGMPEEIYPVAGLGQQYLFHYVRNCPTALPIH